MGEYRFGMFATEGYAISDADDLLKLVVIGESVAAGNWATASRKLIETVGIAWAWLVISGCIHNRYGVTMVKISHRVNFNTTKKLI